MGKYCPKETVWTSGGPYLAFVDVQMGPNLEVIFDFEHVRFDTGL
jgi:hypothetical protein